MLFILLWHLAIAVDPAALIRVTAPGKVGVLLDEFPSDSRGRVASFILSQPDEYWNVAANRQLNLTLYYLVYRETYFKGTTGKKSLPLPYSALTFTWQSAAQRKNENGHDFVIRSYTMSTYIVTTVAGAGVADSHLANIGGKVAVPITLPTDPFLILQRSGYACMDESQNPLNSVDAESPDYAFDSTCTVEKAYDPSTGNCEQCHCSVVVRESCESALSKTVGKTPVTLTYTRVAYNEDLVLQAEAKNIFHHSAAPGADLTGVTPGLEHNFVSYLYVPEDSCERRECVEASGWRRLLNFDASHLNIGRSMLDLGVIDFTKGDESSFNPLQFHNLYYWDTCHQHPHFSAYASYTFGAGHSGHKQGFCIMSTNRLINDRYTPLATPNPDCGRQGVESGWADNYNAGIRCQWVDVTNVDTSSGAVAAALSMTGNPKNWLCEGLALKSLNGTQQWVATGESTTAPPYSVVGASIDKFNCTTTPGALDNNYESVQATIPTKGNGLLTRSCPWKDHNLGPKRDCEFALRSQIENCAVGASVTMTCSIPSTAKSQVLRVCESSIALGSGTACRFNEPHMLANVLLSPGVSTPVQFRCPSKRDAIEVGGKFSSYAGPVFNRDPFATVTCTAAT